MYGGVCLCIYVYTHLYLPKLRLKKLYLGLPKIYQGKQNKMFTFQLLVKKACTHRALVLGTMVSVSSSV